VLAALAAGGYYIKNYADRPQPSGDNKKRMGKESEAEGMPASRTEEGNIPDKVAKPMMIFKGGDQGFVSLKLDSVEPINHNTKRFRFELPEDGVSGLHVACAYLRRVLLRTVADDVQLR